MIDVLISGQAGAYAVLSRDAIVYSISGNSFTLPKREVSKAFEGCTDVRSYRLKSKEEAHSLCRSSWRQDRALRFALSLLDQPEEADQEIFSALEGLLEDSSIEKFVRATFFTGPFPSEKHVKIALEWIPNESRFATLISRALDDQPEIHALRQALDSVDPNDFESDREYHTFRQRIFQSTAQYDLIRLRHEGKDIELYLLRLNAELRAIRGARDAIAAWTAPFRRKKSPLPELRSVLDDEYEDQSDDPKNRRGVYEQIRLQQATIADHLKKRSIADAKRLAEALLRAQESNSTVEQIAKTLSLLSNLAKTHGVPELQLEWAERAVERNPSDVVTFGHLVDALIGQNRLHEASEVVDRVEAMHPGLFARTARARLARARGDFEDARRLYLEAAKAFPHDPENVRTRAGAAEALRDMGRYDEALKEYENLLAEEPTKEFLWNGLASVYLDMGDFTKAIQNFGKALVSNDVVARCGRATAYRLAGNFEQALRIYDQVIREYPNNEPALCGRAEVYRSKGQLEHALKAFEIASNRNPFTSGPIVGKFEVLRQLGRTLDAQRLIEGVAERFPYDQRISVLNAELLEGRGELAHALNAYDAALQKFPRLIRASLSRARILRRLDRNPDALAAYSRILAERPYSWSAQLGQAATYIKVRDFSAAERLLTGPNHPKSEIEWRKHFLFAMAKQAQQEYGNARSLFEYGHKRTPFAHLKRLYSAALARQKLRGGEPSAALKWIDAQPNEVSNIVRIHALAASGRAESARTAFGSISSNDANSALAFEIARRFKILDEPAAHSIEWIYQAEESAILLEAA